ncbi:MAG TPA: dienelactone hydrolase family protein [Actinomycetes bacterium]|nr:dienelactone hydrolase family protein [Actinomycetes bacterium]
MAGSMIQIEGDGGAVPVYLSVPPARSGPGVIVIQEWWGLVPHVRGVADRLAAHGFVAAAPVAGIRAQLERAGVPATFHEYPGTSHAFFNDDRPGIHDADAAERSWDRTLAFFREQLGAGA